MSSSHEVSESGTVVYELAPECTLDDVDRDELHLARVNGVVEYGVFVDLSDRVSGLVHDSNLLDDHAVGDTVVVELVEVRDNGDLAFTEHRPDDYDVVSVTPGTTVRVAELDAHVGETVQLTGEVVQIKQTGGPTIFQVRDGTGVVPCAAFERAGVRAYPAVGRDDAVRVTGLVDERDGAVQLEVADLERLTGEPAATARERISEALADLTGPADVDPLVEWPAFESLRPGLERVAERLRAAVLAGRPIRIRHHADGDGMCAAVPLEVALRRFVAATHADPDAPRHLLRRLPSKAPFYEMEDVTRDLNYALADRSRHGQRLPLLLMLDNGSTTEDTPAYRALGEYDIPIIVVDHHHPDPADVEPLVDEHVNPYLHDEDYRITTGMLCVELARMIDPELTDELRHVPAVAGMADRSKAETMEAYLDLAAAAGYERADIEAIGEALDYAAYRLRYDDGAGLVNDVLNVACSDESRHRELVDFLAECSERDVDRQLSAAEPHVEHERLPNDVDLFRLDVEDHAHRFTYPAPGKTTGELHDRNVQSVGLPAITIGVGPDFAVLRSDGVRLDIPEMVAELRAEYPGAGVSGGGHLVVGSIKFVPGRRAAVVDALVEKMADAEIDEELRSSTT